MTEQIQINRQIIYFTIDSVKLETENGIEEHENQFVGFFKNEPVTEISIGEQIKNENGENLVFNSIDQARGEIIEILKRKIYPPSFLDPLQYSANNIAEIMHKKLIFDIGDFNSGEIRESIFGIMTNCMLASASNPPGLPYSVRIMTNAGERKFKITELVRIRR